MMLISLTTTRPIIFVRFRVVGGVSAHIPLDWGTPIIKISFDTF